MQKFACVALAAVVATSAACVHDYQVTSPPDLPAGEQVTLELHDGRAVSATTHPTPNGVVWKTDSGEQLTPADVHAVETAGNGGGAIAGLGLGLLSGVVLGAVMGGRSKDEDDCFDAGCDFDRNVDTQLGVAIYGTLGSGLGLIIGAAASTPRRYELVPEAEAPCLSVQPTRDGATAAMAWSF